MSEQAKSTIGYISNSWASCYISPCIRPCILSCSHVCAGYQIEKRKPGGDWEKVNDFPITGENATVPDLDEGKEYEFRVAAITGAGVGDYSLNTAPVKVCEKKGLI